MKLCCSHTALTFIESHFNLLFTSDKHATYYNNWTLIFKSLKGICISLFLFISISTVLLSSFSWIFFSLVIAFESTLRLLKCCWTRSTPTSSHFHIICWASSTNEKEELTHENEMIMLDNSEQNERWSRIDEWREEKVGKIWVGTWKWGK